MNRNGNETESFAGNFVASDEQGLFFEVPAIVFVERAERNRAGPQSVTGVQGSRRRNELSGFAARPRFYTSGQVDR